MNAENRDIKHLAEKACISYIKSIYLMKDKEVFKFKQLDCDKLAQSFGLANSPQINFVSKDQLKNAERKPANGEDNAQDSTKLSRLQRLRLKIKEKKEQKKLDAEKP